MLKLEETDLFSKFFQLKSNTTFFSYFTIYLLVWEDFVLDLLFFCIFKNKINSDFSCFLSQLELL